MPNPRFSRRRSMMSGNDKYCCRSGVAWLSLNTGGHMDYLMNSPRWFAAVWLWLSGTLLASLCGVVDAQTLPRLTDAVQIEAGDRHACAITEAGGVKCWGNNDAGQLGDDSQVNRTTPVDVRGLDSGIIAIAAGGQHNCALTQSGGVKCWGHNSFGQLGDNTQTTRRTPVDVNGLGNGVVALAAGYYHSCALLANGSVRCWGYNSHGQLGDGSTSNRLTPVTVAGLTEGATSLAAGDYHSCAITPSAGVKCWGLNNFGQLGINSRSPQQSAVDVIGVSGGVSALAGGNSHTCALTQTGAVKCWGNNGSGQLGDNSTSDRLTAVDAIGLGSGIQAITAGGAATCALSASGAATCWGSNNYGQLGDDSTERRTLPTAVVGLGASARAISAGGYHTCALAGDGAALCWGRNDKGQLGRNLTSSRLTPMPVSGLGTGSRMVAAGFSHSCALTDAGGVKCWGSNDSGQLGDGTTTLRLAPVDVPGLSSGVSAVVAGLFHTCALTTAGGIKCWGNNLNNSLGDGTSNQRLTAVDVAGLGNGNLAIAAGNLHTCALTAAGAVKCWGYNIYGQLGDDSTTNRATAVDVIGLSSGVSAISTGGFHSCAVSQGGGLKCWGYNGFGELGDGSTTNRSMPTSVAGLASGVATAVGGYQHHCALTSGGGMKCWGYNNFGTLGDSTLLNRSTPVDVVGLSSGVRSIAAGPGAHTCAVTQDGRSKCWGYNEYGQVGDGSTANRHSPIDVLDLGSTVAIAVGRTHTCAVNAAGATLCWGSNEFGELGIGDRSQLVPSAVLINDAVFRSGFE